MEATRARRDDCMTYLLRNEFMDTMIDRSNIRRRRRPGYEDWVSVRLGNRCWRVAALVGNSSCARVAQRRRVPFELGCESGEARVGPLIQRGAGVGERSLDVRDREQARDAGHAELAEHRAELHRGADAAERAGRVADDRRRPT